MTRTLMALSVSIFACSEVSAVDVGYFCENEVEEFSYVLSFLRENDSTVAVIDGNFSTPLPAQLNPGSGLRASIDGPDFLGVLDDDLKLSIVSKRFGLETLSCIDITQAARTLNSDFGTVAELTRQVGHLEAELSEARARFELENLEAFERIEELERLNEGLIRSSRMWQGRLEDLQEQLEQQ